MEIETVREYPNRWALLVPLIAIFIGLYSFTYSGRIESGDTLKLFNATASMVDFGDALLDKSAADNPPDATTPASRYPLMEAEVEPLQLILSAPFYWVAEHIPGIGLVHAVWFFNVVICAFIVSATYSYAVLLGYRPSVGLAAAIMLGVGTILWPYSKTFFREPLACLMILLTAMSIERWRQSQYRSIKVFIISLFLLGGAFLAKEAVIFALPALTIIAVPSIRLPKRIFDAILCVLVVLALVMVISTIFAAQLPLPALYAFLAPLVRRTPDQIETVHRAFHSYLMSIGGSIWGTSPVLLLAIPGVIGFYLQKRYRYFLAVPAIVLGFAFGYAFLRGDHWFGGLSWPPRFLIPIIPFLVIGSFPFLERVLGYGRQRWLVVITALIFLYSLWIQVCAVSYDWGVYINLLPAEANGLGEWGGGLNLAAYLRWVLIPTAWGRIPLDFAWVRTSIYLWPIVSVLVVMLCGLWLYRIQFGKPQSSKLYFNWRYLLVPVGLVSLIGLGLYSINGDENYSGGNPSLRASTALIQANTGKGDVLLLADNEYMPFFLNNGKMTYPRVISLPDPPGEQPSPEQPPLVRSSNPDALLVKSSVPLIYNLAEYHPTLWVMADFGPWHPWAIRPVERFMVTHYYPIRELSPEPVDLRVRLIEYSTVKAPDPFAFRGPDYETDLRYGDVIFLTGFDLPAGLIYKPGDVVPLSLYWQAHEIVQHDYTVAYFVADANGDVVVQGADTQPAWGFAPTSGWKPGIPQWDNRALRLPGNLAPGSYQIWIRLYQSDNSDVQLPVTGSNVTDQSLGILPVRITVAN